MLKIYLILVLLIVAGLFFPAPVHAWGVTSASDRGATAHSLPLGWYDPLRPSTHVHRYSLPGPHSYSPVIQLPGKSMAASLYLAHWGGNTPIKNVITDNVTE